MFATVFAIINFGIVGWLQPLSRYSYENLRYELRSGALGASIKVGEFVSLGNGMTLRVEESLDKGRDLRGLFVRAQSKPAASSGAGADGDDGQRLAVTATSGTFLATDDPEVILLRLSNGTLVHSPNADAVPRVLSFVQHDLPVNLPSMTSFRQRGDGNLEATLPELARKILNSESTAEERQDANATFHRRIVQCVIMFMLPFLAVALGVPPKRSSSALGVFISLIALVTFHKVTEYGERMGSIGLVDPILAQWVPFSVFLGIALLLYRTLAHVPGGQPLGTLDRWFAKLSKAVSALTARIVRRNSWRDDALSAG
jgi:lipopolysaccharide export system permease protein